MMEKPKKERKFLKILGKVGEILLQELLVKVGKSLVQKIGGKKNLPSIIFLFLFCNIAFASIDSIPYPITGNKQRLGWQTTGNGLVYRGNASDTVTKPSNYANKDIKAYLLLDTVNNVLYNYIASKGGWQFSNTDSIIINNNFTQPVDSLFFDTSVPTNNVDTAKMRWNSDLGTVVLGMYDQVPNELGFKSFWLVKNQTGSTITKGSIVYANGTVGASGRITVAKFIANGSIDAKYLLGITAHDLTDGEDGYVISFGKIRQVNTDTFAAGSILYPSPTVAGVWTDVEPVAPNIDMPIGFCINSSVSNGTIAIRVASGYKLSELHDVAISSPVDKASLYYKSSEGLWRDTTAALLVSDTAAMLTPYLRKLDTLSLSNRINLKLNISDTSSMLSPYFRDADTTSLNLTSRFAAKLNTSDTASMLTNYLRTGTAASTYLPLTGGTLSGALSGTTGTFNTRLGVGSIESPSVTSLFTSGSGDQEIHFTHSDNVPGRKVSLRLTNNNSGFYTYGGLIYALQGEGLNQYTRMSLGVNTTEIMHLSRFSRVGIMNNSPSYTLDVNGTFNATSNSLIGGTLGVTGATTLSDDLILRTSGGSRFQTAIRHYYEQQTRYAGEIQFLPSGSSGSALAFITNQSGLGQSERMRISETGNIGIGTGSPNSKLDVRGSAIFNEDSGDNDFRVESDGNANMVFVDASTDRVGIGTSSPSKTLDVNGTLNVSSATTLGSTLAVTGNIAAGLTSATAALHLKAGTSSASSAPLKFTSGTNMTTAEAGAMEFNGTNLLFTPDTTRHTVNHGLTGSREIDFLSTSGEGSSDETITVTGASEGDVVSLGVPNAAVMANTCYTAWVSAANTVTVRFNNYSSSLKNPNPGVFKVFVTK